MIRYLTAIVTVLIAGNTFVTAEPNDPNRIHKSTVGPVPPQIVVERDRQKPVTIAAVERTLNVPGYLWRHGCAPTSVGMIVGYYDGLCHVDLIDGDASTQTEAVNQAIASGGELGNLNPPGDEEHYEDYSTPEDDPIDGEGNDTGPFTDDCITKSRTPHSDNCIGDFMKTSRSNHPLGHLYYGYSYSTDVGPAFNSYVNMQNPIYKPGYQYYPWSGSLWSILTTEIDNGRPMVFGVDCDGDGVSDHAVAVVGYRTGTPNQYGCLDTWAPANEVRWEDFLQMADGTPWGIAAGYSFSLVKWVQLPDQTDKGIDIRCDNSDGLPRILADDFECMSTGPITKITLWASWQGDVKGKINKIHLGIYEDLPADDSNNPYGFSVPGNKVWSGDFSADDINETFYADLDPNYEWWWDAAGLQNPNQFGDQEIWQYEISIDSYNAFTQQGDACNPIIYWLDVSAELERCLPSTGYSSSWSKTGFGWKTSKDQWNDAAVWSNDEGRTWNKLSYPSGHAYEDNPIDLAFVVDTSQAGGNMDFGDCPESDYPTLLIHNGARHTIVPQIHLGPQVDGEPSGRPDSNALGDDNTGVDDEDGVTFTSQIIPGYNATVDVMASVGGKLDAWMDFNADGDWNDAGEQIFNTKQLIAGTNHLAFDVPAEAASNTTTYARFRFSTAGGLSYNGPADNGEVEDYAVQISPEVKWIQWPDITSKGIDICCNRGDGVSRVLADDFECVRTGPITKIILWGSWKNDIKGKIERIHLSIHSDIPDPTPGNPSTFSKPNNPPLWQKEFLAGDFNETLYANISPNWEWWWDVTNTYVGPNQWGDHKIWQYDIDIDPCDAFIQQGDPCDKIVYWLDVYVMLQNDGNNPKFGWKTSKDHWNDDAVWLKNSGSTWNEMRYHYTHPSYPNSIDLAFAIITEEEKSKSSEHLKWSQPAIEIDPLSSIPIYCGWDQESYREIVPGIYFSCWDCPSQCYGDADCNGVVDIADMLIWSDANGTSYGWPAYNHCADFDRDFDVDADDYSILLNNWGPDTPTDCPYQGNIEDESELWHLVADDFRCLASMPVTSIHWWGSYNGWDSSVPPETEPNSWRIGFWSNIKDSDPNDPCTYSYPEKLLWQIEKSAESVERVWVGYDLFPSETNEACFQYYVNLEPNEYFQQNNFVTYTDDNTFWISIAAVYSDSCDADYLWGWKSRPWHWMDDAVTFEVNGPLTPGLVTDACDVTPIENDAVGGVRQSYDMAFELDTHPSYIKWEQAFNGIRNWKYYEDIASCMTSLPEGNDIWQFLADDWHSYTRKPITAIVWWGSYICYGYEACLDCASPLTNANKPDYFLISVWTDMPSGDPCNSYGYGHPHSKIWEYQALEYDEVLVGYDKYPSGEPNEPVFRYSVRLPESKWFMPPNYNQDFWLSIAAVYTQDYPQCAWGWTNHPYAFGNYATYGLLGYADGEPDKWQWYQLGNQTEISGDLSFMLFTDPNECSSCANYNCDDIVDLSDYTIFSNGWTWTGQAGGYNNSDLNCDGVIDFKDLAIFVKQWLETCP